MRQAIDIAKKQEAIKWIGEQGGGVASRVAPHFRKLGWDVDASTYRKWWRNKEGIMAAQPHQKRLHGGGRKPLLGALEDLHLDAIIDRRLRKEKVTREWIGLAAKELYASLDETGNRFVASDAWISKFMKRNDLSLRKRTNLTVLSDEALVGRAIGYMKYLTSNLPKFDLEHTVLMDKTAV
ncbi:hypothetical protein PPTG_14443 [Phytophthora nicotianae INRA-310]|uniref:HTH CENPB-type domain-containing protein n=1 Tax=Phytophthora nicotianae (strain INRA-310) TaxID=761204 RepID=W2PUJ3_PHYN3|nr:hypothetical protein PPTG_14443 [Phytophthora nicotianae INRA-310]ETN04607.1 hypothetical protein PPTG_14443 [Phytophthora nicotianae INRA-310]